MRIGDPSTKWSMLFIPAMLVVFYRWSVFVFLFYCRTCLERIWAYSNKRFSEGRHGTIVLFSGRTQHAKRRFRLVSGHLHVHRTTFLVYDSCLEFIEALGDFLIRLHVHFAHFPWRDFFLINETLSRYCSNKHTHVPAMWRLGAIWGIKQEVWDWSLTSALPRRGLGQAATCCKTVCWHTPGPRWPAACCCAS